MIKIIFVEKENSDKAVLKSIVLFYYIIIISNVYLEIIVLLYFALVYSCNAIHFLKNS